MQILVPGTGRPYLEGDSLDLSGPVVLTIPNVMSPEECAATIAKIEELGPEEAPVSLAGGAVMRKDIRNNKRVMFDGEVLAAALYTRIAPAIPQTLHGARAVGANERFRAYRYDPGERFAVHTDGCYRRNAHERSELTLMVYLNEGFGGGCTRFHDYDLDVVPKTGMALVFQHLVWHEGCEVTSGTKYVLRSDVMFRAIA
jgi:hypothetical protein